MSSKPGPSVVHIPKEEMNYQQAMQWRDSVFLTSGRNETMKWLLANDPMVSGIYRMLEDNGIVGAGRHLAAVLILVNMMREKQ